MVADVRGMSYLETFRKIRETYSLFDNKSEDMLVFVDADHSERLAKIESFVENCLGCKPAFRESSGYYVLSIGRDCLAMVS